VPEHGVELSQRIQHCVDVLACQGAQRVPRWTAASLYPLDDSLRQA
jgi:hypothetical protein